MLMRASPGPNPSLIVVQDLTSNGIDKVEYISKLQGLAPLTTFCYTPSSSVRTVQAVSGKAARWLTQKIKVNGEAPYDPQAVQYVLINCRDGVHVPIFFLNCLMQSYVIWRSVPLTVKPLSIVVFVRKPNKSLLAMKPTKVITLVENTDENATYAV